MIQTRNLSVFQGFAVGQGARLDGAAQIVGGGLDVVGERDAGLFAPAAGAVRAQPLGDQGQPVALDPGMGPDRGAARAFKHTHGGAFGLDGQGGVGVVEGGGPQVQARRVVRADLQGQRPLSGRGHKGVDGQQGADTLAVAQAVEARGRQQNGLEIARGQTLQPGVDIAAQQCDAQVGAQRQNLGLAPQAGGADPGPFGQVIQAVEPFADEGVAGIFARGYGGQDQSRRRLDRHILERMDGQVAAPVHEGGLDLAREQGLAPDLHQPPVLDAVAAGDDGHERQKGVALGIGNAQGASQGVAHMARLGQGQGGAAGADAKGAWQGEIFEFAPVRTDRYLGWMSFEADYSSAARAATPVSARALTVLGIETSCDETAASVVRQFPDGTAQVLSSVVHSQVDDHAAYGGVVPEIAARSHVETLDGCVRRALAEAGADGGALDWSALDAIAATAGPGLVGGVMVGLSYAKGAALGRDLPLVAVNHLEGHAVSARLGQAVAYPFLLLLVSGGHCQLLEVRGIGDMTRLGTTLDDAAGEAFDKIAKVMGLGYPGGPALERLAARGRAEGAARFVLPRALLGRRDCDFSFSGLKTAAARLAQAVATEQDRADLALAVQDAIARQLAERSERALALFRERHGGGDRPVFVRPVFVVAGGVAANRAVRARLTAVAEDQGFDFVAPPMAYCTDNAAMIALAGAERLRLGLVSALSVAARPRWPLDEARALADPTHRAGRKGAKA